MKTKTTVARGTKVLFTLLLSGVIGWTGIVSPGGEVLQADAAEGSAPRLVENLGRGLTAVYLGENKVYLSWRLLGTESQQVTFDIYRRTGTEEVKLNDQPLTQGTNYTDTNVDVTQSHTYIVKSYVDGRLQDESAEVVLAANPEIRNYFSIPLQNITSNPSDYFVQHGWPGDLDGDGEYEYVVTRIPVNGGNKYVEAYSLTEGFLWRIDLGPYSVTTIDTYNAPPASVSEFGVAGLGGWRDNDNITVFDLDSDGKAEVLLRTFEGVTFADGQVVPATTERAQYVSVVDGRTGTEAARTAITNDYAADGPLSGHFGIAYLDGEHPSLITALKNRALSRNFQYVTSAYDYAGGALTERWRHAGADGEFFHQIRILDLNGDGKDEVSFGGWALDDNGETLYSLPGVVHGDRFHITDIDPDRPGLEQFGIQQAENGNFNQFPWFYADAATGEIIRTGEIPQDVARGTLADIDPTHNGLEMWSSSGNIYNVDGEVISSVQPSTNFRIWWDGDVLGELLDKNFVEKWDWQQNTTARLFTADDVRVNSRNAPVLYGDLLGDWREEILYETSDFTALRLYTTTIPSDVRIYTLPHNPAYRNGLAVKGYMQSLLTDYYLGEGMTTPTVPDILPVVYNGDQES
ncbi:rhamnogalacturonan lyase family protein [Paenibacillus sp. FSL K6-2393]|uniref:rhamnogalacturonan lyase family protein n=1 Tax=Paenibacillus sp. FSL K6-2393 TaxID=2921475 RepID=UPI0030FC1015